jgi:predicted ester cyclase
LTGPQKALNALLRQLNAHDLDAIASLAPDNARFRESHRRMLAAFPDVHVDAEWTVADADKAVVWGHITGTHQGEWRGIKPTGRAIDVRGVIALAVDPRGRVTDFWLVNDWLGIATQLGATLSPPPA